MLKYKIIVGTVSNKSIVVALGEGTVSTKSKEDKILSVWRVPQSTDVEMLSKILTLLSPSLWCFMK